MGLAISFPRSENSLSIPAQETLSAITVENNRYSAPFVREREAGGMPAVLNADGTSALHDAV